MFLIARTNRFFVSQPYRNLNSKLLTISSLLFFLSGLSQAQVTLPANELGQVQYQETVRLPDNSRKAKQLMSQARSWVGQYYTLDNHIEQQYDQEHGILFIKALLPVDNQVVRYTLSIETRMGRYRATLTDLIAESKGLSLPIRSSSPTLEEMSRASDSRDAVLLEQAVKQQTDLYEQIDSACRATLANLSEFIRNAKDQ